MFAGCSGRLARRPRPTPCMPETAGSGDWPRKPADSGAATKEPGLVRRHGRTAATTRRLDISPRLPFGREPGTSGKAYRWSVPRPDPIGGIRIGIQHRPALCRIAAHAGRTAEPSGIGMRDLWHARHARHARHIDPPGCAEACTAAAGSPRPPAAAGAAPCLLRPRLAGPAGPRQKPAEPCIRRCCRGKAATRVRLSSTPLRPHTARVCSSLSIRMPFHPSPGSRTKARAITDLYDGAASPIR